MPFYEYECPSCRYYLEVLQKISDKPVKKCPSCGKAGFKRLMSAPVFRLKGSGWYETDFKSDKEGQRNLAGAEPAEPKADAPETKAGANDKATATPEAATAVAEKAKPESPPADKSQKSSKSSRSSKSSKSSKSSATAARSVGAKRAVKRPAARASRKPAGSAARGSRRR